MGFRIATKMSPKDLGDPTRVREKSWPEEKILHLGTIFGEARGLSYRANDNNPETPSIALTGIFEGVPHEGDEVIRSNTLFLSGSVQDIFVNAVRGESEAPVSEAPKKGTKFDVSGNVIRLAVEVGVKKANTAVGYTYVVNIAGDPVADNTLDSMRDAALAGKSLPALSKATARQIAAPKGKAKKKK